MKLFVFVLLGLLIFGCGISCEQEVAAKNPSGLWISLSMGICLLVALWWAAHQ